MAFLLPAFHIVQACLSAYTGVLSYTSIVKLQKYESQSKKAAKYSSTAEHQLHKTTTTQASGALATLLSLVSSVALSNLLYSQPPVVALLVALLNTASATFAHSHISNFWRGKANVPLVGDFNDAITTSNQMRSSIGALAVTWAICCAVYVWKSL